MSYFCTNGQYELFNPHTIEIYEFPEELEIRLSDSEVDDYYFSWHYEQYLRFFDEKVITPLMNGYTYWDIKS